MLTFKCDGWLSIRVDDDSQLALVKLKHVLDHVPYGRRQMPNAVKDFILQHCDMKLRRCFLVALPQYRTLGQLPFTRRDVYHLWIKLNQQKWRRADDELESARLLINEAAINQLPPDPSVNRPPLYRAENVDVPEMEGTKAIAFVLPEILWKWGGRVRELALDSTFETNKSQYEVYAALGELAGSRFPLGYLLLKTTKDVSANIRSRNTQDAKRIRWAW
ncbi:hypothetical protein C8F01DRAFT_994868 [Mycena amicta]|nr:hypothetical protein C8F01DRAFT_994868 [Mycena amicta]